MRAAPAKIGDPHDLHPSPPDRHQSHCARSRPIDEALPSRKIFRFTLRGREKGQVFIDMGDQFLALTEVKEPHQDRQRHLGIVVDDRARVRELAQALKMVCTSQSPSIGNTAKQSTDVRSSQTG